MEPKNLNKSFTSLLFPFGYPKNEFNSTYYLYILTDIHRNQFLIGISSDLPKLKKSSEISSNLNPRYGSPSINKLVFIKKFHEPKIANDWLQKVNLFTKIQKERLIRSINIDWEDLWMKEENLKREISNKKNFFQRKKTIRKLKRNIEPEDFMVTGKLFKESKLPDNFNNKPVLKCISKQLSLFEENFQVYLINSLNEFDKPKDVKLTTNKPKENKKIKGISGKFTVKPSNLKIKKLKTNEVEYNLFETT